MAIVTLEDMEGEVTVVTFPKVYEKCASVLMGEVDEHTGALWTMCLFAFKGMA